MKELDLTSFVSHVLKCSWFSRLLKCPQLLRLGEGLSTYPALWTWIIPLPKGRTVTDLSSCLSFPSAPESTRGELVPCPLSPRRECFYLGWRPARRPFGSFWILKERSWGVSAPRGPPERARRTSWGAAVAGAPWPSSVACSWWVFTLLLIL